MNGRQAVALGESAADLVVRGGRIVLPTLGETRERDVAVAGDRVAALFEDADHVVGPDTLVVDADGDHVVPGFVDAHTHVDVLQSYAAAYHRSLLGGTTTVVSEASAIGGPFGAAGVRELLAATADLPVDVRLTVPPQAFVDTFEPRMTTDEDLIALADLLDHPRVVGTGEIDWIHVVGRPAPPASGTSEPSPVEGLFTRAREVGARVTGHGAGLAGEKLDAFASVVDDDHEAISAEGFVERVASGVHAIGRAGSIRDDVGALAAAYERLGPAELSLCSDGTWPEDLLANGHMDAVVARAIEKGVEPVDAVRMATVNPARHFGMTDRGTLAPGSLADVVVLDDLESVAVRAVVAGGEPVVRDGEALVGPRAHDYPDRFLDSVTVRPTEADFHVPTDAVPGSRVRAIDYREGLLSGETTVEPPAVDGRFAADPDDDLLLAALFDRRPPVAAGSGSSAARGGGSLADVGRTAETHGFVGFLRGLGLERGAAATTLTWELPGLLVVGTAPAAMAHAARQVADVGGGWAVVDEDAAGEPVLSARLPLPVAGVASRLPVAETAAGMERVRAALRDLGCGVERPLLGLQTLTFPGVPALKLSLSGYAHVLAGKRVGLDPDE